MGLGSGDLSGPQHEDEQDNSCPGFYSVFRLVILSAMLVFGVGTAGAQTEPSGADFTTQGLYAFCKSKDEGLQLACGEYLSGIVDVMKFLEAASMVSGLTGDARHALRAFGMCPTTALTGGAWIQIFVNWAERNHNEWGSYRSFGAMQAYREAFPCK